VASLKIQVDAAKIASVFKEFARDVEANIKASMGDLAAITYAKVKEDAATKLKGSPLAKIYMDNLGYQQIAEGIHVVYLNEAALFIENGGKEWDMKPGLLKNAKVGKNGNRYQIIPFKYDRGPTSNSASTNQLISYVKSELKQQNVKDSFNAKGQQNKTVPFKQIEYDKNGNAKLGKLHEFNFGNLNGRLKAPGRGNTAQLAGLHIYQSMKNGNVKRDILTFRTVSSGDASKDKWFYPAKTGIMLMDEAQKWAMQEWENKILPEILRKWGG
jgi:hypothetical protein